MTGVQRIQVLGGALIMALLMTLGMILTNPLAKPAQAHSTAYCPAYTYKVTSTNPDQKYVFVRQFTQDGRHYHVYRHFYKKNGQWVYTGTVKRWCAL